MGIEPTPPAWKAGALPLSYTRNVYHQKTENQPEATVSNIQTNENHGGSRIRTCEGRATRFTVWPLWPLGYPAETSSQQKLAVGFEPTTTGLQNRYSAVELR